jgi:hypothetical protein
LFIPLGNGLKTFSFSIFLPFSFYKVTFSLVAKGQNVLYFALFITYRKDKSLLC